MLKVVIVGAGLSGLTAAWELRKAGHEPIVLEARDRVGGRTWSQKLENGQLTERGGEYVFPSEFAIRRLAAEVGVPILTHNVRYSRRTVNGQYQSAADVTATESLLAQTLRNMLADGLTRLSVDDVHRAALGADFAAHPQYRRIATSLASDPSLVSAEAALLHESASVAGYVEDAGRFVLGNQSLSIELARRLGDAVRLESPVSGVDQSERGVQVRLADGSTLDADAAVISVPLPLLRTLELGRELEPSQQAALDHRMMGTAAKLGVPLSSVDEDIALSHAELNWWSWRSMSSDGEHRIDALSCFAGSRSTLDALDTASGSATWVADLQRLRPDLVISGTPLLTDWSNDRWALGSYSAPTLDWCIEDAHAFEAANGRVSFAGEHTGLAQSLNGAVASGVRAALALAPVLAGAQATAGR